jgi:hypothetical protein
LGKDLGKDFFPPYRAILEGMATKRPPSEKTLERRFEVAISSGNIRLVERLIAQGAKVHGTNVDDFPAIWAIENGQAEILKLLIRHGVDPRSGDGVLFLTGVFHDQQAILKLLLSLVFSPDLWRGKSLSDIQNEASLIYRQIENYVSYDELHVEREARDFRLLLFDAAMTCGERVRPDPPKIKISDVPAKPRPL